MRIWVTAGKHAISLNMNPKAWQKESMETPALHSPPAPFTSYAWTHTAVHKRVQRTGWAWTNGELVCQLHMSPRGTRSTGLLSLPRKWPVPRKS